MSRRLNKQDFITGLVIGILATAFIMGYFNIGKSEDTHWCNWLRGSDSDYCYKLYDKAKQTLDSSPQETIY